MIKKNSNVKRTENKTSSKKYFNSYRIMNTTHMAEIEVDSLKNNAHYRIKPKFMVFKWKYVLLRTSNPIVWYTCSMYNVYDGKEKTMLMLR